MFVNRWRKNNLDTMRRSCLSRGSEGFTNILSISSRLLHFFNYFCHNFVPQMSLLVGLVLICCHLAPRMDNDFLVWRLCNNTPTRAEWKCKQAAWGEESSTCHEFLARQGWQRGERQRRGARKARRLQRLRWWLAARGRSSSPEKSTPSWSWDGEGCSSH